MEEHFICPECGSDDVEVIKEKDGSLPFAATSAAMCGS